MSAPEVVGSRDGGVPFNLPRSSGNKSGCLNLSPKLRFSPKSPEEAMSVVCCWCRERG
jgi:hypothetical protein